MRVCLVNPPQMELHQPRAYIPLGLAYIGAVLEEAGVEAEVLNLADGKLEEAEFVNADWHGITCTSATYPAVKRLVHTIKERSQVVVGGIHPSVFPEETLRNMKPAIVMTGEAEYLFRDLITGKINPAPIMNAGIIEDLNQLPFPARHLFDYEDVVDRSGIHGQDKDIPATTVITSRGCPYKCAFCCKGHPMLSGYRFRSAGNVHRELQSLINDYDIAHVRFVDDEFTLHRQRTVELMKKIVPLGLTWVCITRADSLDEGLLALMKKAGCVEVHVGVETGSNRLLKLMNKQMTAETQLRGIEMIKSAGIRAKAYLMYQFPGENEEDRNQTVEFLKRTRPDKFTLSRFTPLPGSAASQFVPKGDNQWFYPDDDSGYIEYKKRIMEALE